VSLKLLKSKHIYNFL